MTTLCKVRSIHATPKRIGLVTTAVAVFTCTSLLLLMAPAAQATLINSIGGAEAWFRADKDVQTTGIAVDQWNDQSGNNDDATLVSTGKPTLVGSVFNGLPAVRFAKNATADDLSFSGVSHASTNDFSFFAVVQPGAGFDIGDDIGFMLGSTAAGAGDSTKIGPWSNGFFRRIGSGASSAAGTWPSPDADPPEAHIVHLQRNTANLMTSGFDGGTPVDAATVTNTSQINRIGGPSSGSTTQDFPGDIAELVFFGDTLNTAERVLTENYLSSKYDIALGGIGSLDIYAGDTPGNSNFDFDVFGIGRDDSGSGGSLTLSNSGAVTLEITAGLDDLDFVAGGFELNDDPTQGVLFLDGTNLDGNETVTLSFGLTQLGISGDLYLLLYDADDPNALSFTGLFGTVNGDSVDFVLGSALVDGFFGIQAASVPEPSSFLLLGLGALSMLRHTRRRRRRA